MDQEKEISKLKELIKTILEKEFPSIVNVRDSQISPHAICGDLFIEDALYLLSIVISSLKVSICLNNETDQIPESHQALYLLKYAQNHSWIFRWPDSIGVEDSLLWFDCKSFPGIDFTYVLSGLLSEAALQRYQIKDFLENPIVYGDQKYFSLLQKGEKLFKDQNEKYLREHQQYMVELSTLTKIEEPELSQMFTKMQAGDKKAEELLFKNYLSLVPPLADAFAPEDITLQRELIFEGNLGLLYALKHSHLKGERDFELFAAAHIKHFLSRAFSSITENPPPHLRIGEDWE